MFPDTVRVPAPPTGLRALDFSTSVSLATADVEVLRRPKSRDGRVRFLDGVGLVPVVPLQVADAGNRGGGISPRLGGCGWDVGSSTFWAGFRGCGFCDGCDAAFDDARLQPLMLSLRRRDEPEDGVSGSVEVEVCAESDVSFFCSGRGPATVMLCNSTSLLEDLYSPLGRGCRRANSPLPLGNEFDAKGVVACRVGFSVGIGMVPISGCASSEVSVARRLKAELLLRRCL
jgi:hypothetical protein